MESVAAVSFMNGSVCHLKHLSGKTGFITLYDALDGNYNIHVKDSENDNEETVEKYSTTKELVNDGWGID